MTATQAPTSGPLWMTHVIGPDDIYPAPDHATAVEWCAALNASMPASDVLCVAVPAIWTGTSEAHAEGLSETVEGWTSPRQRLAPTAPVEASGSERDAFDSAASAFIATSFGFSGPNDQDTPLQAAAREVGWMLSEVVDRIEWNKRGQAANALGRLATSIDGLVWPWEGDDPRHDQIRDAWRSYADNSADDDGRIDLTEVETCVAIGCMKAMQLLSPDLRPQPSGETR